MKKIQTATEIANKEARKKRIGGIVIIALLLLSTAGFALNGVGINSNGSTNNDGLIFDGQSWIYYLGGQPTYRFTYGLNDLNFTDFKLSKNLADLGGKSLYIDSENNIGTQDIAINLGRHVSKIGEACYGSCNRDLQELTCDTENILIVIKSNYTSVKEENNCIFIEEDLRVIDAFLYRILGLN
ncbi:MAG: hypothetical protein ACP5NS_04575 [Candidatus Pacearchaeota archaeon]